MLKQARTARCVWCIRVNNKYMDSYHSLVCGITVGVIIAIIITIVDLIITDGNFYL